MLKKILVISFFLLFNIIGYAQTSEQTQAQEIIVKLQERQAFYASRMQLNQWKINDANWIKNILYWMAVADQDYRTTLMHNIIFQSWSLSTKKSFLLYFLNFNNPNNIFEKWGVMQQHDITDEKILKHMLQQSSILSLKGWPVISMFGRIPDFDAWLIMQHGQFVDKAWQMAVLVPRLQKLSAQGESCIVAYAWLKDESLQNLPTIQKLLQTQGEPWNQMLNVIAEMKIFYKMLPSILNAPASPAFKRQDEK